MFNLFNRKPAQPRHTDAAEIERPEIDLNEALEWVDGIPLFSRTALERVEARREPFAQFGDALTAAARGWVKTLNAEAFDGRLSSGESKHFMLVGDVPAMRGKTILSFCESTLSRFQSDLEGIMRTEPGFKMPILALSSQDDYYRYISAYFSEGHYGGSSGMFVHRGLPHFIFPMEEMWVLEHVISHEMLHSVVSHLPLPAWLNEGLAVNAEFRYGNRFQVAARVNENLPHHRRYWTHENIQSFWNGDAFFGANEGQELAYDLARRLAVGLSGTWPKMREFVLSADLADAGEAKAEEIFGYSLAIPLEATIGLADAPPIPQAWSQEPHTGGYQYPIRGATNDPLLTLGRNQVLAWVDTDSAT